MLQSLAVCQNQSLLMNILRGEELHRDEKSPLKFLYEHGLSRYYNLIFIDFGCN